jgi:DNA polymerase I
MTGISKCITIPLWRFILEKLFLVDASSILYRAFYAVRNLSTSKGKPTNAIFGTMKMTEKLIKTYDPKYFVFVFDLPAPTFRHEAFADYKANREETPKDLQVQIEPAKNILRAMGIPLIELAGFEADDIIATLAKRAKAANFEAVVVTADKDLFQIVEDGVSIIHTKKEDALLDRNGVVEVFGVPPELVTDVLALWGDASDNIPGVPGIGEKGAKELVLKYGGLENILQNVDKIEKKSYREGLQANIEQAKFSKELATIKSDVPIDIEIRDLAIKEKDAEKLNELFKENEFYSLVEEVKKEMAPVETAPFNESSVQKLRSAQYVGFCFNEDEVFLSEGSVVFIIKRAELDEKFLFSLPLVSVDFKEIFVEFALPEVEASKYADLNLASYLVSPETANPLESSTRTFLHSNISENIVNRSCQFARLAPFVIDQLKKLEMDKLFKDIEMPVAKSLAKIEWRGIFVDVPYFKDLSEQMEKRIAEIETEVYQIAGATFNLASPKQVGEILFEKLNLPVVKKTSKTKSYSTDNEVLEQIAPLHPVVPLILEHRGLSKLKGTYTDAIPIQVDENTKRVHSRFNQMVTATGRLSSSEPNLQNIPVRGDWGPKIRHGFTAEEGNLLVGADYSQIELRILAHLSGDPVLIEVFKRGEDIHTRTASQVFDVSPMFVNPEMRRQSKAINFGLIYGKGAYGLSQELGISQREAKEFIDRYFGSFPKVRAYLERTRQEALESGETKTILGRRRFFPNIRNVTKPQQEALLRQAVNAVIQGSAADLIKKAMIEVDAALPEGSALVLQVHDELIVEAEEQIAEKAGAVLKDKMENALQLTVPLTVSLSIGKRWDELK